MTTARKSNAKFISHAAVIVINNLDYPIRYAAWFEKRHSNSAIKLAKEAGFHVLEVIDDEIDQCASRLRAGSVKEGFLSLATVDENLATELEMFVKARLQPEDRPFESAEAPQQALAESLSAGEHTEIKEDASNDACGKLTPGSLVLTPFLDRLGASNGWYEAFIVRIDGPEFLLRWRDFPREGLFTRTRRHIVPHSGE